MTEQNKNDTCAAENLRLTTQDFLAGLPKLMDAVNVGLWDWHPKTGTFSFTPQCEIISGYAPGELPRTFQVRGTITHPEDRPAVAALLDDLLSTRRERYEHEYRLFRKDGGIMWVQEKAAVIERAEDGTPVRVFGMLHDVTHIKQSEKRMEQEYRHREYIAHLAGLGGWEWDILRDHLTFNDDYRVLLGLSPEEMNGPLMGLEKIVHPDDLAELADGLNRYMERNEGVLTMALRCLNSRGEYIWLYNMASIVERDEKGHPVRMRGGVLNIDARMQAEQQLKQALKEIETRNEELRGDIAETSLELERSRQMTSAMFESNPYINLLFDDHYCIVDCNPAAVEYFRFDSKEALLEGFTPFIEESIPPTQPTGAPSIPLHERFLTVMKTGYIEFETELVIHGQFAPFRVVMKKIRNEDTFAIIAYMVDLRQLKEAKNELLRQERFLSAVNEVATLLLELDQADFTDILHRSLRTLGGSVAADRVSIWKRNDDEGGCTCTRIGGWRATEAELRDETHVSLDCLPYFPDWHLRDGKKSAVVIRAEELGSDAVARLNLRETSALLLIPVHIQGRFWGITAFSHQSGDFSLGPAEESILRSGGMLIASAIIRNEINEAMVEAKNAALESTRAKSEFLSRMSHEIRTPMNAIIGMNTLARKSNDLPKIRTYLEKMEGSSRQLLSIINDILDMSKIEEGKFEISYGEFDFERMLQNVINVVTVKLEEKHQEFLLEFDELPTHQVVSDELRLSQVLINLLGNANKFTPEGGSIALKLSVADASDDEYAIRVTVSDSGIGISDEQQQKLFQSFEQADNTISRRFGGTGLGLAICKKIVTLMGGKIWVESELDKGSDFIFEVRARKGAVIDVALERATLRDNLRVLVVDDTPDVLEFFSSILDDFSLKHDTACCGRDAIDMVERALAQGAPYGIVFLDWRMPGMNGGETAREIKRIMGDDIIVILISVADWAEIEYEAREYGLADFLPKPVLPSVLYNTILKKTGCTLMLEARNEDAPPRDWHGKRLLLAEDIAINQEILLSILEDTGVCIDCANDGLQALEMFERNGERYDLILMDIQMPGLDGIETTRKIRTLASGAEIPIVAMTANAFKEDVRLCLDAGMNDHIAKPIEVPEMMRTIARYLES